MTDLYLEFRILEITKKSNELVELKLRKIIELPPEEKEPEEVITPPDPLTTIVPETAEEKLVLKVLLAFRKMGAFPAPTPYIRPSFPRVFPSYMLQETTVPISEEEYKKLGRPGIGHKIRLGVQLIREAEKDVE